MLVTRSDLHCNKKTRKRIKTSRVLTSPPPDTAHWTPVLCRYTEVTGSDSAMRCTNFGGRDSDSLHAGMLGDLTSNKGVVGEGEFLFSTLVQTATGAHPVPSTNGYLRSFAGGWWPGRGADHPHPSTAEFQTE